jgi:hypothetical protein
MAAVSGDDPRERRITADQTLDLARDIIRKPETGWRCWRFLILANEVPEVKAIELVLRSNVARRKRTCGHTNVQAPAVKPFLQTLMCLENPRDMAEARPSAFIEIRTEDRADGPQISDPIE